MKKRLCAVLLGVMLFVSPTISVYAENAENAKENDLTSVADEFRKSNTLELAEEGEISTGTQENAQENETDVDGDIREDIQSGIPAEIEEISIRSTEDFLEFSKNCRLDTWSVNKKVTLENDISLLGTDFTGVPTFGGYFDGGGHTISGLSIGSDISYCGLFSNVQKTGVILNLNVQGTIIPAGDQIIMGGIAANNYGIISKSNYTGVISGNDYVGGIVGINQLSGVIDDCKCSGYVHGLHFTGGIAGQNMGNISDCENTSMVNTTNTDTQITIDAMSTLNRVISLVKNINSATEEANSDVTVSDAGGIAGQSIGIISRCVNTGDIGYEHVGYNIGGIAGRQSGYIHKCTNSAVVLGRKDVGGIVGQAEPYITVDLSTDIAYQLSEAIGKLHELVTRSLRDTKNQSNVISNRLSVIQNFTTGALNDVRFIANGTIDYANGISGATSEAFSRVDYVLDEAVKQGGAIEHTQNAAQNASDSASDLREAVSDLNYEKYLEGDQLKQYQDAKLILSNAASKYNDNFKAWYDPYYNYYVANNLSGDTADLEYILDSTGDPATISDLQAVPDDNDVANSTGAAQKGHWRHSTDQASFPVTNSADTRYTADQALYSAANSYARGAADTMAKEKYVNPIDSSRTGKKSDVPPIYYYDEDVEGASQTLLEITQYIVLPKMTDEVRGDASKAMSSLEKASDELKDAGKETKSILSNIAGRDSISFPTLSDEYRARTASFVDNMQGMNDNFGMLNGEMNNATGVLVDDLQAMSDQFNTIMLLFSDAVDGVLERDYTNAFEDVSFDEANTCTDATIDGCINYGKVEGDIDTAGIAGTMAIDYEYDKESDLTGIKDSKLNTSYLTKCVLRDNNNFSDAVGEKNYVGGVCGLQEMGTIIRCANMGNMKSRSGEYIGGICGRSLSYIVEASSSGILGGNAYVGGISGDGMHISDCRSLVKIQDADSWYGAIAGHVADEGVVRNNTFISDDLAGIDRTSYTAKAEPVQFSEEEVPYDFKNLTISFVLEDEDLKDGKKTIKKGSKRFGESIDQSEYPRVDDRAGYYVVWDVDGIDNVRTDEVITAKYVKYRTTIGEEFNSSDDTFYQGEVLVDGEFKEDDRLGVDRTINYSVENLSGNVSELKKLKDYERVRVIIPDDGRKVHRMRFKPDTVLNKAFEGFAIYMVSENGGEEVLTPLGSTGEMGQYKIYEVEGNELTFDVKFDNASKRIYFFISIIIAVVVALAVILILVIVLIKRNKRKISGAINNIAQNVSQKIESKEQLFYDDSRDAEEEKEQSEAAESDGENSKGEGKDSENTITEQAPTEGAESENKN